VENQILTISARVSLWIGKEEISHTLSFHLRKKERIKTRLKMITILMKK
jgi:hypothetical protein